MKKIFMLSLLLTATCFLSSLMQAKINRVYGIVRDASGAPLPGVTVMLEGSHTGAATDLDGKYELSVSSQDGVLIFSQIGLIDQKIKISGRDQINVVMKEDTYHLDEVVVVGYGVQKKAHLTGSVAAVNSAEIVKTVSSNVSQALVGKLPGIITKQSSGAPGSDNVTMLVRGQSSWKQGGPLTLVDGTERPLSSLDPSDIESISVLKDAASCAVYGMRGADGVILVTTKKGSEGKAVVHYNGTVTMQRSTTLPKMMNGTQYMQYYNLARVMDGLDPYFTDEEIAATHNGNVDDGLENTDWTAGIYRPTFMQRHSVSLSGGSEKIKYYVSGGYLHQNGLIKGMKNEKKTLRANIDAKPGDNWHISVNLGGSFNDYVRPGAYSVDEQGYLSLFKLYLYSYPFVPKMYQGHHTGAWRLSGHNPEYGAEHSGGVRQQTARIETSGIIEYDFPFIKGLKASLFGSYDWVDEDGSALAHGYMLSQYMFNDKQYKYIKAGDFVKGGSLNRTDSKSTQAVIRPSLSWSRSFGKHEASALFLYEATLKHWATFSAGRRNFSLPGLYELDLADKSTMVNGGNYRNAAWAGYIGRLNYSYAQKYLAELSFRYDGSYLFSKENRWGFFPSASLGWVLSEEDFLQSSKSWLDFLKLRFSAGILGSDHVSPWLFRKQYNLGIAAVAFGDKPTSQQILSNSISYPFRELTWEKTQIYNFGVDFNAWSGLFGLQLDVFYKYTYDILQGLASIYPPSLGGHYPSISNTGAADDRGFELVLTHRNKIGDFRYDLNANITFARNRILSRTQPDNTHPWQNILGGQIGDLYGFHAIGLYQTQEQIDQAPRPVSEKPRLGYIMYEDIDGDGKITSNDYVRIARSEYPQMMFSFTGSAQYKGFDLSIQFQGGALCDRMLQAAWRNGVTDSTPFTRPWYGNFDNAPLYLVENSWREDNRNAEYPRLSSLHSNNNANLSDFWKRNGSYLRLKNLTFGYTFPKKLVNKIGVSDMRILLSGTNLLTFTEFKYLDPESPNAAVGFYPQQRTFSLGIDLSF